LIPKENEKDLIEVPDNIKGDLDIRPVQWIDEVLEIALAEPPRPLANHAETKSANKKTEKSGAVMAH
jgi:ATP-dependent Lon protease